MFVVIAWTGGALVVSVLYSALLARVRLSRAKHPSLLGHARLAKRLARLMPAYAYGEDRFFASDGAPSEVAERRRQRFDRLAHTLAAKAPTTIDKTTDLETALSDLQFTKQYRVPFQYRERVSRAFHSGALLRASTGVLVADLDGGWDYDLAGSYGVNLFGYDFYKDCIDRGIDRVRNLGPVLGSYHPMIQENVTRLKEISGLDEVSFHMSGTEAIMQAVRLTRFHTRRSHVVRFCGAYHGWWDDVQPGVGNPATVHATYTLKDMSRDSLRVLETRNDIACVLVNPLQSLHPNAGAPSDATLLDSGRRASEHRRAYGSWLHDLRAICTTRGIVLIFDEIFVGFRIARGGAQEYFGVSADMVSYGKTVGGGLPVGVLCGRSRYMKRFREDHPTDLCFARGTFNSHPYVMAAMNEFLRRLSEPDLQASYEGLEETWNARARALNGRLEQEGLPVRVANLVSIWTVLYETPSRYNWMFQYYLRAHGLHLSWIGTGRLIFSHNYTDADVAAVCERFVAAATAMRDDHWWWHTPELTDRSIRRQVLRETAAAWLRTKMRERAHAKSSEAIGSKSSPRTT